jgi:hypothetical protein
MYGDIRAALVTGIQEQQPDWHGKGWTVDEFIAF